MLNDFFWLLLNIIEISIFGYFFYVSVYNFILAIFGLKKKDRFTIGLNQLKNNFAIIIPAYKEDNVIPSTIAANLKVDYPKELFELVVIADSFQKETLEKLKKLPIRLIDVSFEESTKVKSINHALNKIKNKSDIMVILDADNVMAVDFLLQINNLFNEGKKIVQGRRLIKNPNSDFAILDDLSEQINNQIFRKGSYNIGGSSSIAGSGFAVDYKLGVQIFQELESIGGFDKEFELVLLQKGYRTMYDEEVVVYDEKVESKKVFKNQRRRWISSQYLILKNYFKPGLRALFGGDFTFFNSAILRNAQLPRILNLGLFTLTILLFIIIEAHLFLPKYIWWSIYIVFILSIVFAIPKRYYNFKLVLSIFKLPGIFITMFLLLFKLKGANKKFIHTPHTSPLNQDD